ncbi:hypothetical protein V1512DRAFT_277482 [Lipomyces arxii]|uniref:uncharacterized protein n=1 Tax=Lipomyces arxii TaxID=56418 RepID=UPI0034CEAF77
MSKVVLPTRSGSFSSQIHTHSSTSHTQNPVTASGDSSVTLSTPHLASALVDDISNFSISPRTALPAQLRKHSQLANLNTPSVDLRRSFDTDDRSSLTNDVIIKNGWLMKRGRRRTWARRWFVLRPTHLTYYKDDTEYKASEIIPISEISTAAILADGKPESKKQTHFAVFTSSRNFHLQGATAEEANLWVADIKTAIRLADQQSEFIKGPATIFRAPNFQIPAENAPPSDAATQMSPSKLTLTAATPPSALGLDIAEESDDTENSTSAGIPIQHGRAIGAQKHRDIYAMSSALPHVTMPTSHRHRSSHHGSDLDFSTSPTTFQLDGVMRSPEHSTYTVSYYDFSGNEDAGLSSGASEYGVPIGNSVRNASDVHLSSSAGATLTRSHDANFIKELAQLKRDSVLKSGYLLRLVKRYNQWRRKWVVLREGSICFYKTDDEYKPLKIIPLDHLIDVMEIDPVSKSKQYCMQLIMSEKRLRLCAETEEDLTAWLVEIKAAMVRLHKSKPPNEKDEHTL